MLLHKGTKILETDRLILRRFKISDAEDMFKNWVNDSEVTEFLSWEPHGSIEVTNEILKSWVNDYLNLNCYNWGIELKDIKEVIGSIGAVSSDEPNYSCEIGYCLSKKYWGKGIMTEALKEVINYLFTEIGMNRIIAKHDTNNLASGKVMAKSGMIFEGTLRQAIINKNNEFCNIDLYSILKKDFLG